MHHTNEVAQSECVLDVHPWVRIWMHNEFLDLGGEKISKSKGHVLVVDTLVERGFDPLAFRYFFLQAHYRQQQAFTLGGDRGGRHRAPPARRPGRRGARRRRASPTPPPSSRTSARIFLIFVPVWYPFICVPLFFL